MNTFLGNGLTGSYTAKTNVGWIGKRALTYEGKHEQFNPEEWGGDYTKNKRMEYGVPCPAI